MASSRNCPPDLVAALAAAIRCRYQPHDQIALGLSGGIDSVVLLHALHAARQAASFELSAHHVHHGLSPHATAWAEFCARLCAQLHVPFSCTHVNVPRRPQESLEAAAREARHRALRDLPVAVVALAQHADDQAETLLLQLLRGAGVAGLAAMPEGSPGRPSFWRPLLNYTRADLLAWARARSLTWIEDESNDELRWRRNALRHQVTPRLTEFFPGYPQTLARSARLCAEATEMLQELAAIDGLPQNFQDGLALETLAALPPPRARNLLRHYLLSAGLQAPSEARLEALCKNLASPRADARTELQHQGVRLVREGGRLAIVPAAPVYRYTWRGEAHIALPHGDLFFEATPGQGLRNEFAQAGCVILPCPRGARFALQATQSASPVRELLRQRGVSPWDRDHWPVIQCAGELTAVPGIGITWSARAEGATIGYTVRWQPARYAAGHSELRVGR